MKNVTIGLSRVLLAVAATGLVGVTAAGCTSAPSAPSASAPVTSASAPSASAAAGPVVPAFTITDDGPTSTTSTASASTSTRPTAQVNAVAARKLQFPNTSEDVEITRYDTRNNMVQFHKVVREPGVPYVYLIPDASDLADHELPLAPGATITSVDPNGFPYQTCPPTHCTPDDIVQSVISHQANAFWAHIHVNAADQIDSVRQSAY